MINIGIQTAQGFLSFTPSVNGLLVLVEYRPAQGIWETVALPGLEEAIRAIVKQEMSGSTPTPPGTTPPPTGYQLPGGIAPSETAEYVGQIKNWLMSQGKNLSGPCGAFEIVANVAWGVQTLNTGAGILSKPDGNNCMSYSTDIICYKDYPNGSARIVDILGDGGGANTPMWGEKGSEENVAMDRWRAPIDPTTVVNTQSARSAKKK